MKIPLGQREGIDLEFKGAKVLEDLSRIGREVVAMLNAKGGSVWIGVGEQEGRAFQVEPIAGADAQASRLMDHLLDTIEPSPRREVEVTPVSAGGENFVLAVRIRPDPKRKPYAQVRGTWRNYLTRVSDHVRGMVRDEFLERPRIDPQLHTARTHVLERRDAARHRKEGCLWLMIHPLKDLQIDIQGKNIKARLCDPALTGNRSNGWHFANSYSAPDLKNGRIVQGGKEGPCVEIEGTGTIAFSVPLGGLHWKGKEREIWPYCLLEYPTSVFRLASSIYKDVLESGEPEILADFAITRIRGWSLRPFSPLAIGYTIRDAKAYEEEEDLILKLEPFQFSWEKIVTSPDGCALEILRHVYEAFGVPEVQIPAEFDRAAGRLVIAG